MFYSKVGFEVKFDLFLLHQIGENEEFICKVKSEGGEGYYEPPEMQWIVGDGYPSYNENPYEKVIQ